MKYHKRDYIFVIVPIIIPLSFFLFLEFILHLWNIDFARPIRIIYSGDDWREHHMFTDQDFIPDPYLFWKPKPSRWINSKGFIGPEFNLIKPKGTVRIFFLGDSNTMGTKESSYVYSLREIIKAKPISDVKLELINAGASGYTSFQGLRLSSEIMKYQPDLISICFGWNDHCLTTRQPDNKFSPANKYLLNLERFFYRLKIYQLLKYGYLNLKFRIHKDTSKIGYAQRVNLEDYKQNLIEIANLCERYGVKTLFITRPHAIELEAGHMERFVKNTKNYNLAMRTIAQEIKIDFIDAESIFLHQPEYFADACHLNSKGNEFLAKEIYNYLRNTLEKPKSFRLK